MTTKGDFNAHLLGVKSVPAAVIFTIMYIPLCAWFVRQMFMKKTKVFKVLATFCALRVGAFVLRAVIAASDSVARNSDVYTAEQILYNVGFAGLVLSTYELTLDRGSIAEGPFSARGLFAKMTRFHHLFRLALTLGIVLSLVGVVDLSNNSASTRATGKTLRIAGTCIIFALVVFMAFQTLLLIRVENESPEYNSNARSKAIGGTHGHYVMSCIAGLIVFREAYIVSTLVQPSHATNELWFYPLAALPELLVLLFYLAPGLVPDLNVSKDSNSESIPMHQ